MMQGNRPIEGIRELPESTVSSYCFGGGVKSVEVKSFPVAKSSPVAMPISVAMPVSVAISVAALFPSPFPS
jgi:hypothetical protein